MTNNTQGAWPKILAALLTANTKKDAAKAAGVSERTVYNYLERPECKAEYEAAQQDLITAAAGQIRRSFEPAITALRNITEDPATGKTARVQAARALLEYGLRLAEYTDLEERIAALERNIKDA